MTQQQSQTFRLKTRASECQCANCQPDRVCAWCCVQGTNTADIVAGAALEQRQNWALQTSEPGIEPIRQALWEVFNG